MIEIVVDRERSLKNLKQIGTPREEEKIYVENSVYSQISENNFRDKCVYVLMGHTERMEGRYATFVEAAIPVNEVEFSGNTPNWNNGMWSEVFREIKRIYEDMIIVGWALDIKGMNPRMTTELERIHREHFGGVHQVVLLMDSLEKEETFYMYKENKLVPKEGFYIYYHARKKVEQEAKMEVVSEPQVEKSIDLFVEEPVEEDFRGGRYRQLLQEQQRGTDAGNLGLAIAVAMLIFVVAVGIYENKETIFVNSRNSIETIHTQEGTEEDLIPVEMVPGSEEN